MIGRLLEGGADNRRSRTGISATSVENVNGSSAHWMVTSDDGWETDGRDSGESVDRDKRRLWSSMVIRTLPSRIYCVYRAHVERARLDLSTSFIELK